MTHKTVMQEAETEGEVYYICPLCGDPFVDR